MDLKEEQLEQAFIEELQELNWEYINGYQMERSDFREVILEETLREAVYRLNPNMPNNSKEEAIRKVLHLSNPILIKGNEEFHKMLTQGVDVGQYIDSENKKRSGGKVYLVDFENVEANTFQAVNQFTIDEKTRRRPDVILFINGLPLV